MYKPLLTAQHDAQTQKYIEKIKPNLIRIASLCRQLNLDHFANLAMQLEMFADNLKIPNIYLQNDILVDLETLLNVILNNQMPPEVHGNISEAKFRNSYRAIHAETRSTITQLEDLHYLVGLKIRDMDVTAINDSLMKAQEQLLGINTALITINNENAGLLEGINAERQKAETANNNFTQFIESSTQTTKELIGLVSSEKVTKEYQKKSDAEKYLADDFRRYSIISLLIASALVLVTLLIYLSSAVLSVLPTANTWGISFEAMEVPTSVLLLAFVLLIPAAYFARESHKHRTLEIINLKTSQNLKSFLPFIEALPEPEKTMVKTYLAINIFSKDTERSDNDDAPPVFIQDLLLKLAEKKISSWPPASTKELK